MLGCIMHMQMTNDWFSDTLADLIHSRQGRALFHLPAYVGRASIPKPPGDQHTKLAGLARCVRQLQEKTLTYVRPKFAQQVSR